VHREIKKNLMTTNVSRSSNVDRLRRSADPHGKTSGRREHRRAASVVGGGEASPVRRAIAQLHWSN